MGGNQREWGPTCQFGSREKFKNDKFYKHKTKKEMDRYPDNKIMNDIDHLLINYLRIIKKYKILNKFMFSSDLRIVRASVDIALNSMNTRGKIRGNHRGG